MTRASQELLAAVALAAVVTASGLWVVGSIHRGGMRVVGLDTLNREQDELQIDWGRWQLEQSTLATHPRSESLARERLQLAAPAEEQTVLVVERRP